METLRTEVCIVGTGPGGSVVASHAARDGCDVLLVERGGYFNADHMTHHETSVVSTLFKDGGLQTTDTFDFYILQGNCVGGSTVLSNAVAFRMPQSIHQRWVDEFGFPASWADMAESYCRVEQSSSVGASDPGAWSPGTVRFLDGCKALGLPENSYEPFTKGIVDCVACGLCNSGCPYESKRTPNLTYLPDALRHGARLLTRTEAWRYETRGGKVTALIARRRPVDGSKPTTVRIEADRFVLSAGAINSPALLLRSRLGRNAGQYTSFNAGVTCLAEWDEVLDAHTGDDMCAYYMADDFSFTVESTINPPGAVALFIPGFFEAHASRMARYRHLFQTGILFPVEPRARVKWNLMSRLLGHEFVHYRMPEADVEKARRGLITAGKIHFAGGAKRVFLPFVVPAVAESADELEPLVRERFTSTDALNSLGSAHPFGGCRLSADPKRGTIDASFRVTGTENLWVSDASVFPTAIAVNPWITISAVADFVATRVLGHTPVVLDDPAPPRIPAGSGSGPAATSAAGRST